MNCPLFRPFGFFRTQCVSRGFYLHFCCICFSGLSDQVPLSMPRGYSGHFGNWMGWTSWRCNCSCELLCGGSSYCSSRRRFACWSYPLQLQLATWPAWCWSYLWLLVASSVWLVAAAGADGATGPCASLPVRPAPLHHHHHPSSLLLQPRLKLPSVSFCDFFKCFCCRPSRNIGCLFLCC